MKQFLQKYKIHLGILGVILFLIIGFVVLSSKEPTSNQKEQAIWKTNIKPGITKSSEVVSTLGEPQSKGDYQDHLVFNYKNPTRKKTDQIYFEGDEVYLVKDYIEESENKKLDDFTLEYGVPEAVYYGPHSPAGFHLYVFSSRGIAILAHERVKTVIEVWYFTPMTTAEFLSSIGKNENYTSQPPADEVI